MHVSETGLELIERFEGFVDHIYDDGTGVLTVGFGTTSADISPLPSHVTREQAEQLLREELARKYEPAVNGIGVPLNQNQFDALVSLAYNCGPGIVSDAYQIGRDLRARNFEAAASDFMHYVFAGGRELLGLVTRRNAERQLFLTPAAPPKPEDPHHYLRFASGSGGGGLPGGPFDSPLGMLDERKLVEQYDGARRHQLKYHRFLKSELEPRLLYLANRLMHLAYEHPAGPERDKFWTTDDHGWRQEQLRERGEGKLVVP